MQKKKLAKRLVFKDTSIIPYDILFFVLVMLPIESLLRFKIVSKSWKAMICDQEFKKTYLDQSKTLDREKLLLQRTKTGNKFEFRDLQSSKLTMMGMSHIPLKRFQRAQVLCSGDGLLLLKNREAYKYYVLWNPSTKEYQTLRYPYCLNERIKRIVACGLCYDSRVDNYKVIFITRNFYVVYSLNNDSWTPEIIFPFQIETYYCSFSPGISSAGCIFWSLSQTTLHPCVGRRSTIIYFDAQSDEVKKFATPDFVGEDDLFYLASLKSCLCLYGGKVSRNELQIWIMEQDGSWKWLMNVCKLPIICQRFVRDNKLLCCTKNGEVVFQDPRHCTLSIYNPEQQQFVPVHEENENPPRASICLDSLCFTRFKGKRKRKQEPSWYQKSESLISNNK